MKVLKLTPTERAAIKRKWQLANVKAQATARNAKLFTKYALGKKGWKVASLDNRHGFEYKGVVDLVAVKPSAMTFGLSEFRKSEVVIGEGFMLNELAKP